RGPARSLLLQAARLAPLAQRSARHPRPHHRAPDAGHPPGADARPGAGDARPHPAGAGGPPHPGLRGAPGGGHPPRVLDAGRGEEVRALRELAARSPGDLARGQGAGPAGGALLALVRRRPAGGAPGAAAPHPPQLRGRGRRHLDRSDPGGRAAHPAGGVMPAAPLPTTDELRFDDVFLRKLERLAVVAKRVAARHGRGERRTRHVGSGIEFADHRDYAPGDDLRHLDWNLYGRLERPLVRLFDEDEDLPVYVLVDSSASMGLGQPRKLDLARAVAAALAYVALTNLDRVAIYATSDELGEGLG